MTAKDMEEDTVKIEKDVLLETYAHGGAYNKYSLAILQCEVGDSFLFPDEEDANRTAISQLARRRKMRVATRKAEPCPKTGKSQRRVWRIE